MSNGRVDGKVAIVTGGAGGIGSATVKKLVMEGARVVVADLDLARAEAIARDVGDGAWAFQYDATDPASVQELMEATASHYGRLDILHNNAAVTDPESLMRDVSVTDIGFDLWDHVMTVNVRGYLAGCKYAIPHMIAAGGGSIIQTSSAAALAGDITRTAYGVSKGAINALTLYVATQFGPQGIRCNSICPGAILTEVMLAQEGAEELNRILLRQAVLPRLGRAEDVAALVCFLASDEASFITGQIIGSDGGHLIHQPHFGDTRTDLS